MLSTFLEGPEAGRSSADFPEGGLGALCPSPSTSSMGGMVGKQHPADRQEAEALVFQTVQPKPVKDIHPERDISLNQAPATFDNICTFSKESLLSKPLHQ